MRGEEILVKAKDHLANGEHWIQGKYQGNEGHEFMTSTVDGLPRLKYNHDHCLMGAIQCVVEDEELRSWGDEESWPRRIEDLLREVFIAYDPDGTKILRDLAEPDGLIISVESLNDRPNRTWEDIDKVLDKAIARAGELGI